MSTEDKVLEELKRQAGDEIIVSNDVFQTVKNAEDKNSEDLASLGEAGPSVDPSLDIPKQTIEERLNDIGLSKDMAIEMILELSDTGYIEEDVTMFGGKFKAKFRTAKITDSKKFVDLFDSMDINTQAKGEYYLNLYALASILIEFNGEKLDESDVVARAEWIEEKLPVPIYKGLIDRANKFHAKIELLNSDEVADFF